MAENQEESEQSELLKWVSERPELLKTLGRFREMEADESLEVGGGDAMELEILELIKGIGAEQFAHCVQSRNGTALKQAKAQGGGQVDSKKN